MRLFYFLTAIIIATTSCTNHSKSRAYSSYDSDLHYDYTGGELMGALDSERKKSIDKIEVDNNNNQRIVLYDANISIEVKTPDSTNTALDKIAGKYNGYVVSLGSQKSQIRVETKHLDAAVSEITTLGKLKSKSIYGADVTDQYIDNEIRLENAKKARERYLELLAKAENVEAALKVEIELERLNGQIDLYEGILRKYSHLSEYSTITVYMHEKVKPGLLGYIGIGIYEGIKWLFVRN